MQRIVSYLLTFLLFFGLGMMMVRLTRQAVCTPRKTCKQFTSCWEARLHLHFCGNTRLDGDKDGVPCESLCR